METKCASRQGTPEGGIYIPRGGRQPEARGAPARNCAQLRATAVGVISISTDCARHLAPPLFAKLESLQTGMVRYRQTIPPRSIPISKGVSVPWNPSNAGMAMNAGCSAPIPEIGTSRSKSCGVRLMALETRMAMTRARASRYGISTKPARIRIP